MMFPLLENHSKKEKNVCIHIVVVVIIYYILSE